MQIGRVGFVLRVFLYGGVAKKIDGYAIASHIVVGNAVQRLVKVSHKMDDEPQGVRSHPGVGPVAAEQFDLMLDRAGNAADGGRAGFRDGATGCVAGDVNVVPRTRFRPQTSEVVSPSRGIRHQIEPLADAITR